MTNEKRGAVAPGTIEGFPVLPLRDIVVFPNMIVPLFVAREKSIRALEEVAKGDRPILLATQKNAADDDPSPDAIYSIGTLANVLQLLKLPDGTVKVLVEGQSRAKVRRYTRTDDFYEADAEVLADVIESPVEIEALGRSVVSEFESYVKLNKRVSSEILSTVTQIEDYSKLADTVASQVSVKISDKQDVLETVNVARRLEKCLSLMESEISVLQVEKRIRTRVKRQMEKTQREYYLNEQMKAIQKELGDEDGKDDLGELEERIKNTKLSKEARDKATAELKKLRQMSPMSAEATVVRNYLDWLLSIPWGKRSKVKKDLAARKTCSTPIISDWRRSKSASSNISPCRPGPTSSLARSSASSVLPASARPRSANRSRARRDASSCACRLAACATKRRFAAIAEPISAPCPARSSSRCARPRPPIRSSCSTRSTRWAWISAAIRPRRCWRCWIPEQNASFNDHYLEVDYDLSGVMFVTTANTLNIPAPLMDRMEIIRIAGYTEDEKAEIARRHLIPNAIKKHGLQPKEWSIEDAALKTLIRRYTREAGVRNLEREISNLARKAVKEILLNKDRKEVVVTDANISDYLGVPKYRYGEAELEDQVGAVTGLAWTEVGGELLTIEGVMMPGKGRMTVTGNLRDVMKESISAAASYVRSRAVDFGIEPPLFDRRDIHVHVPEGATPKDGPSAGVAMATAIISVMTGIPVRREIAMTGEITLRGRVLPIGGLKEKLLAALRGGLTKVLIPEENAKDLAEIPDAVKNSLEIVPVSRMEEVLKHALVSQPTPIVWHEPPATLSTHGGDEETTGVRAH